MTAMPPPAASYYLSSMGQVHGPHPLDLVAMHKYPDVDGRPLR